MISSYQIGNIKLRNIVFLYVDAVKSFAQKLNVDYRDVHVCVKVDQVRPSCRITWPSKALCERALDIGRYNSKFRITKWRNVHQKYKRESPFYQLQIDCHSCSDFQEANWKIAIREDNSRQRIGRPGGGTCNWS